MLLLKQRRWSGQRWVEWIRQATEQSMLARWVDTRAQSWAEEGGCFCLHFGILWLVTEKLEKKLYTFTQMYKDSIHCTRTHFTCIIESIGSWLQLINSRSSTHCPCQFEPTSYTVCIEVWSSSATLSFLYYELESKPCSWRWILDLERFRKICWH